MKTKIRRAKRRDLKRIVQVYQEAYSAAPYLETWDDKILKRKLKRSWNSLEILVFEVDRKIEGFIMAEIFDWYDGLRGHIEDFGVSEKYRGGGLGDQLLEEMEKHLKNKSIGTSILEVNEDAPAKGFYLRRGYEPSGYVQLEKKI